MRQKEDNIMEQGRADLLYILLYLMNRVKEIQNCTAGGPDFVVNWSFLPSEVYAGC
jgi:hypothetical protein